ncbi:MAG: hypothetical protein ABSF03_01205 [Streptosporangiaceae bacterium]
MSGQPPGPRSNGPWWRALPALETRVPCGPDTHPVRWQDGVLGLPAHPDPEGEVVLAALGGEKAGCIEVAAAWHQHADDLGVMAVGPRDPADSVNVSWEDVQEFREAGPGRFGGRITRPHSQPMRRPGPPAGGTGLPPAGGSKFSAAAGAGLFPAGSRRVPRRPIPAGQAEEPERIRAERLGLLSLLALGPEFQMVLSGTVAAAWADGGPRARERHAHRAALEAALTGRLAPAAARWLGIDPDQVDARLHDGPGWGGLELSGTGAARHLRAALPAGWLAAVWACGLTVAGGHLVVAVQQAAWPDATVLAVPEPGRDPVLLSVRAGEEAGRKAGQNAGQNADKNAGPSGDRAHWEVTGVPPAATGGPDEPPRPSPRPSRGEAD